MGKYFLAPFAALLVAGVTAGAMVARADFDPVAKPKVVWPTS